jgi:glycosyltransferase involved in cell wall biosynthesis
MVYDAIDTNGTYHSDNSFRKKLAIAQDAPLIGLIARCVEGKGYDDFIKAAAIVMRQSKNAKFVIVGNGPGGDADYETSMRSLSRQLGLNGFLKWAGWQQDMGYVLRDMDIFVHASSTFPEGLPHVLLEAMVAGKPIVATALPSTKEVVVHEKTGLLVEPGNHQALAVGILKILSDSQMASNFVSAGRIRARELFSLDVHVRRIESIYYSLLY